MIKTNYYYCSLVQYLVVLHAGVCLNSLATAQLGQDRGLTRVTGANDQDV